MTSDESVRWLTRATVLVETKPECLDSLFVRARRDCGDADADWIRTRLLLLRPDAAERLYREGDVQERLSVLRSLHLLDVPGRAIIEDALRSNDLRIVEAAMGPRSSELDDHSWRRAVLKFAYLALPLSSVHHLDERADDELRRMLAELVRERTAAGRSVPSDVLLHL